MIFCEIDIFGVNSLFILKENPRFVLTLFNYFRVTLFFKQALTHVVEFLIKIFKYLAESK